MEKLQELCFLGLKNKNLETDAHKKRLELEFSEIKKQKEESYFLELYDKKLKFPKNEHNLLVSFLLDIVKDFEINKEPEYTIPDYPDVDTDLNPFIRDQLKEKVIPQLFGEEYVCNIGSYNTYGLKSALIDMTRIFGGDRNEIIKITKAIGLKDDEGDPMSWDKAMEIYPQLKKWVESNPEIAKAAKNLLYSDIDWEKFDYKGEPPHRNRSIGMHAGGLIISSKPISEIVPLIRGKDGQRASAWVEGLHGQDLTLVGLVKYDFLGLEALNKIVKCIEIIRQRHGIDGICALPNCSNWSDLSYLEDKLSLEMANEGDLKGIFQFDSEGIRRLTMQGGVSCFNDIVAFSSLYRPGPMESLLHERYIQRKKGKEEYELHPLLHDALKDTYGVLCIHEDSLVLMADNRRIPIKKVQKGDLVLSLNVKTEKIEEKECLGCARTVYGHGLKIILENGFEIICTSDHKILTFKGMKESQKLDKDDLIAVYDGNLTYSCIELIENVKNQSFYDMSVADNHNFIANGIVVSNCYQEQIYQVLNKVGKISLIDCQPIIKAISKKNAGKFQKFKDVFVENGQKTLEKPKEEIEELWNQIEAFAGYAFNKSHATSYSYLTMRMLYLKSHFPIEFYACLLSCLKTADDRLNEYRQDAKKHNIIIEKLDINKSGVDFKVINDQIYWGFAKVKGIGDEAAKKIVENQPYKDFHDFLVKFGTDGTVVKPLIGLRAFNDADPYKLYQYYLQYKEHGNKKINRQKRFEKTKESIKNNIKELLKSIKSLDEANTKEITCLKNKYERCIRTYREKDVNEDFLLVNYNVDKEKDVPDELKMTFLDSDKGEFAYYGFIWTHPLEKCLNFAGNTFEDHRRNSIKNNACSEVEVLIKKVTKCKSQKGTNYWQLSVEDCNFEPQSVNVWSEDFKAFEDEFKDESLVRLRLMPPSKGFRTYAFESFPRFTKKPSKEFDYRLIKLK